MDNISSRKRIADMDVVNDVTSTRQSVITRVVIRFLGHDLSTELQQRHMINYFLLFSHLDILSILCPIFVRGRGYGVGDLAISRWFRSYRRVGKKSLRN